MMSRRQWGPWIAGQGRSSHCRVAAAGISERTLPLCSSISRRTSGPPSRWPRGPSAAHGPAPARRPAPACRRRAARSGWPLRGSPRSGARRADCRRCGCPAIRSSSIQPPDTEPCTRPSSRRAIQAPRRTAPSPRPRADRHQRRPMPSPPASGAPRRELADPGLSISERFQGWEVRGRMNSPLIPMGMCMLRPSACRCGRASA